MSLVTDYLKIRRTSALSIPSGTPTTVTWNTEDVDLSGYWASGAATKIVVPTGKSGTHSFSFTWGMASGLTVRGFADCAVFNASDVQQRVMRAPMGIYGEDTSHLAGMTYLNAGEYLTFLVYQVQGSSINLSDARLELTRLSE